VKTRDVTGLAVHRSVHRSVDRSVNRSVDRCLKVKEGGTAASEAGASESSDDDTDGGDEPGGSPATAQGTGRQHGPVPPINRKTTIFRVWYEVNKSHRNYEFTYRYIERRDTRQTSVTTLTRKYKNKIVFDDAPKKCVPGSYTVETMPSDLLQEFFEDQAIGQECRLSDLQHRWCSHLCQVCTIGITR
jgi:hypothetical protein